MKKVSKANMKFMENLMAEFNDYSELVSLNYYKGADKDLIEWNRGHLYSTESLMKQFAKLHHFNLTFTFGTHPFLDFELEYRTVHLEGEDTTFHRTNKADIMLR